AVRLLVQRPLVDVLARADRAALLDCRGEVEDALGPQEERVQRRQLRALELEALVQPGVRRPCREAKQLAATLGVQLRRDGDRLEVTRGSSSSRSIPRRAGRSPE